MLGVHIPQARPSHFDWPLPGSPIAPKAMANPPTVASGTQKTLPRTWFAASGSPSYPIASHAIGGLFSFCRGIPSDEHPTIGYRPASTVTGSRAGDRAPAAQQFCFIHEGSRLELQFHDNPLGTLVRVDDEFVSLTPLVASGASFVMLDFGERAARRIDIIGYKCAFVGVHTDPDDRIQAAPVRGPRTICVGDSFSPAAVDGWTNWFAHALGWDDVWTSAVGGSGFGADASGLAIPIVERIESDVIAYRPDLVFFHAGLNDLSLPLAALADATASCVEQVRSALPGCIVAGGFNTAFGVESWSAENLDSYDAAKQAFEQASGVWMSTLELPYATSGDAIGSTAALMDNLAQGRAGNTGTPDAVNAFTGFRINTSSSTPGSNLRIGSTVEIGNGATRERVVITSSAVASGRIVYGFDGAFRYPHNAGEPVREVAPSYLTGLGTSVAPSGWGMADRFVGPDGFHHNAEGHRALGLVNASMVADHLRSLRTG